MKQHLLISFFCCLFFSFTSLAQTDLFTGSWHMEYIPPGEKKTITIDLQIGTPEKNQLYPAELKLQYDSFEATYHLLLVRRNIRQLGIGRNKVASSEKPFSIGTWTVFLNGVFDLSRDLKGIPTLHAERLFARQYGISMPDLGNFPEEQKLSATGIRDMLKDAGISLKKINNLPFEGAYTDSILNPHLSGGYYGISGMMEVNERNGSINFNGNKKNSGVVSVILNGNTIVDQNALTVRKPVEDIKLDTGVNILVFYADNYGKTPANTGNLHVDLGDTKFSLDFADTKDIAATFIVTKLYYAPEKEKEKENNSAVSNSILRELSEADLQKDIKNYHYPNPDARSLIKDDSSKAMAEKALLRDTKSVANIKANARKIILALWDDAVEDGDSISLNINGHWVVQRFPVKKKPQFIEVTLDPGPNKITFIADNLGAIIPNTAILEIIDGKQRRAFMIDTDLGSNNLINILYELRPD